MMFVLDCSVTMGWCFDDEQSEYCDEVLATLNATEAVAPVLWLCEVVNVLAVAEKRNRISEADSMRFLHLLSSFPIWLDDELDLGKTTGVLRLARQLGIFAYDAVYLELAVRRHCSLATCDKKLREGAKALGVPLFLE